MLTKTRKIKIFLGLLKSVFNDNNANLNDENCIEFYHFLLDSLEEEASSLQQKDREYYIFLNQIIEILSCFDRFLIVKPDLEAVFFCENKTKRLLLVFLQYKDFEYEKYIKKTKSSYNSIKHKFFS